MEAYMWSDCICMMLCLETGGVRGVNTGVKYLKKSSIRKVVKSIKKLHLSGWTVEGFYRSFDVI